ncbi:MAG: thioredoxin domain-containing protein [Bacteroidetes bacterium]|nr:MAG: thioredoxin domain-containing protein [Bacteroidota bacterium]TAF91950.1 MAG: thioredoxin domain-containing protein [Bacteroidota bacterium]
MNLLHLETSKYLLQHANNPVHWWPWCDAAFEEAKRRNVPVLVSIGYTACHWCHVMEHESFENAEVAAYMNEHFVNIKVDREERPDVDAVYMDALQAIAGSGGWPLNMFVLPNRMPFYGGTYFPPQPAYNRPSWLQVLQSIQKTYASNVLQLESQADNLAAHLANAYQLVNKNKQNAAPIANAEMQATEALLAIADTEWGGFGNAPKFLQTGSILYLTRHHWFTNHAPSLAQAELTVQKMLMGGIYDQLGGGIARYSTDKYWQAPHFEKMLYDNALFISTLAELFGTTKKAEYAAAIEQTVNWLLREMKSEYGLFYASIDADSEGEEGKYYTWQAQELKELLGADYAIFKTVYQIEDEGNWEHTNILWRTKTWQVLANELALTELELQELIAKCHQKLLPYRQLRVFPEVDDKQLLGWNALLIAALASAGYHCNNSAHFSLAKQLWQAVHQHFQKTPCYFHTFTAGKAKIDAFADDYAYLIQAGIALANYTGERQYWLHAWDLQKKAIELFSDADGIYFYYTNQFQPVLVAKKVDTYDGATPCANSVFAHNLQVLGTVMGNMDWCQRAAAMVQGIGNGAIRYPNSFSGWSAWHQKQHFGSVEVVVWPTAEHSFEQILQQLQAIAPPYTVFVNAEIWQGETVTPALLEGKNRTSTTDYTLYICIQNTCLPPVNSIVSAAEILKARALAY